MPVREKGQGGAALCPARPFSRPRARAERRETAGSPPPALEFTAETDSPLEGGVTCELVSVSKFPVSRENTGNFIDSELSGASTRAKKAINSMPYEPIPYASEQGIF
jgi:hypothetical protein